jgi:phosphoglycerate dehydrogenase-like enzyme
MGQIGRAVGRIARALGMVVVGVRRSGEHHPEDPPGTRIVADAREAAAAADHFVVTAALTPETRGLVSAEVIAALRPTAQLINVARSAIVDQDALVAALREGRLAAAALDVFDREPLPVDSPLWDVPNLLISPHMSGDTTGYTLELMAEFGEQLRRYRRGEPLLHQVDVRRGY